MAGLAAGANGRARVGRTHCLEGRGPGLEQEWEHILMRRSSSETLVKPHPPPGLYSRAGGAVLMSFPPTGTLQKRHVQQIQALVGSWRGGRKTVSPAPKMPRPLHRGPSKSTLGNTGTQSCVAGTQSGTSCIIFGSSLGSPAGLSAMSTWGPAPRVPGASTMEGRAAPLKLRQRRGGRRPWRQRAGLPA